MALEQITRAKDWPKEWLERRTPWSRTQRALTGLLETFAFSAAPAENRLLDRILNLKPAHTLSPEQAQWFARLRNLALLRGLVFGTHRGRRALQHAFALASGERPLPDVAVLGDVTRFASQDLLEAATKVSGLYWELYRSCEGEFPGLENIARRLYHEIFAKPYVGQVARAEVAVLTDQMQADGGLAFFVLNCARRGGFAWVKALAPSLLHSEGALDESTRTALYWINEVIWFSGAPEMHTLDAVSAVRYWTHVCLTNPERTGFLEIESPVGDSFGHLSELAREAFAFREYVIALVLELWGSYQGPFDGIFTQALRELSGERVKVYRDREAWAAWWRRDREQFLSDIFYWIEGNLSYAQREYADALKFYERALEANPGRRSVQRNRALVLAKLGETSRLQAQLDALTRPGSSAANWLVAALASQMVGDRESAEFYLDELRSFPDWATKADWRFSTFCLEQGATQGALGHAELALAADPSNVLVRFHLAQVLNAVGRPAEALATIAEVAVGDEEEPWMVYLRFTLERDLGHVADAVETLRRIPESAFEDPQTLAQAIEFARGRGDLVVLRRLRSFSGAGTN